MQRYFLKNDQFVDKTVRITESDAHHIQRVMRMSEGERIICCNENGQAALCEIEMISTDEIQGSIIEWLSEEKKCL